MRKVDNRENKMVVEKIMFHYSLPVNHLTTTDFNADLLCQNDRYSDP